MSEGNGGASGRPDEDERSTTPDTPVAWRLVSIALLTPGLGLFLWFTVQPEPTLPTGSALLVDVLLRTFSIVALVCFLAVLFARELIARRASVIASAASFVLAAAVLSAGLWSPVRDLQAVVLAGVTLRRPLSTCGCAARPGPA